MRAGTLLGKARAQLIRARAPLGAILAALAVTGCGLLPALDTGHVGTVQTTSGARATSDNEVPTPPGPRGRVVGGAHSPTQALREFASVYINWTAQDVSSRLRGLARQCVGQARSELQLAAAEVAVDTELKAGGIGNRGTVEAVARLPGADDRYVVITREQTTARASTSYAGLGPEWHLTIATVEHVAGSGDAGARKRWAVSGWQPQS